MMQSLKNCLHITASHFSNSGNADAYRADRLAFTMIRAVAKSFYFHLIHHGNRSLIPFWFPLRQAVQVGKFCPCEKRSRRVRTCSNAGTASNRSEEHTSDSSHVAISYAVFCL